VLNNRDLNMVTWELRAQSGQTKFDVALAADRPVLVEVVVDPEFPMIPPHVTLEATAYAKSVLKGDPDAKHMIGETIKTAVAGVFRKDGERGE